MRRSLKWGTALTASALLTFCLIAPTGASAAADAECPGPGTTTANPGDTDARYAQTFTAVNTGELTTATVFVTKSAGPDFRLDILPASGGAPAATGALGSATIADSAIPNGVTNAAMTGVFSPGVPVTAGQQYALATNRVGSTYQLSSFSTDPCPGGSLFFSDSQTNPFEPVIPPGADLVFQTNVEPPAPQPPDTQITRAPKAKTKRKTATFEFVSTESGSSFECVLDGKQEFKACTSPLTVKVKKGKHTFQVRATDSAGNADGTPASASWKVKKKHRKK